jgi:hypothetical protein
MLCNRCPACFAEMSHRALRHVPQSSISHTYQASKQAVNRCVNCSETSITSAAPPKAQESLGTNVENSAQR